MWSARMSMVKPFEHLICGGRNVGEGDPRVLVRGQTLPVHEVLVALAEFARVEDGMKFLRGRVVRVERERERKDVGGGMSVMGFEERDVEDWMKARKVGRETKLVGGVGDGTFNGERAELTMVELVGRT